MGNFFTTERPNIKQIDEKLKHGHQEFKVGDNLPHPYGEHSENCGMIIYLYDDVGIRIGVSDGKKWNFSEYLKDD